MRFPQDLFYTKEHEWAKAQTVGGKNIVTVGITDHAQGSLGDIVFVELPKVGRALKKGETFGVVESIKAVSDLYSPIDGTVTEINQAAVQEPSVLNRDPHAEGWLIKLEAPSANLAKDLLSSADYEKLI